MDHFELVSQYNPTGDQPQAIKELVEGFKEGNQCQTLLGVTGSGKTFTMANVIQQMNEPTLIIAHNFIIFIKYNCFYMLFFIKLCYIKKRRTVCHYHLSLGKIFI